MNDLSARLTSSLYRKRLMVSGGPWISFSSSDYLGLSRDKALKSAYQAAIEDYGFGSGASALVSGYQPIHQACERVFADFLKAEKALLFPSGYTANLAILSSLRFLNASTTLFLDKHSHASLYDGAVLSTLKTHRFHHQDVQDLKEKINKLSATNPYIITESVFSMSGDQPNLQAYLEIACNHDGQVFVDEAHGFGVIGEYGQGLVIDQALDQAIPNRVYPLGKAFASQGAVVVGQEAFIETLIQFARPYIYSTAVMPSLACAWIKGIECIQDAHGQREHLKGLIQSFKYIAQNLGLSFLPSDTPIQCLTISSVETLMSLQTYLCDKGFHVAAIRPPSVPPHGSLLRFSLTALHSEEQIRTVLEILAYALGQTSDQVLDQA